MPLFLKLHAAGLLCPGARLRFETRCRIFLQPLITIFFDTPPLFGESCSTSRLSSRPSKSQEIILSLHSAQPLELWGKKLKQNTGIDGGLLTSCTAFAWGDTLAVRHIHIAAAARLSITQRAARRIQLLLNLRAAEQDRRKLLNPVEVTSALNTTAREHEANFEIIVSGTLPVAEQVRFFASADIAVMYHGSANVHAFWMPADSVFVEIQPGDSWHCANAYQRLPLVYILALAAVSTTSSPGSCPKDLVKTHKCGLPGGACPAYELEHTPLLTNHRWGYHRGRSRAVHVPRLVELVSAILQSYRSIPETPARLEVASTLSKLTSPACLGYARSFTHC